MGIVISFKYASVKFTNLICLKNLGIHFKRFLIEEKLNIY